MKCNFKGKHKQLYLCNLDLQPNFNTAMDSSYIYMNDRNALPADKVKFLQNVNL